MRNWKLEGYEIDIVVEGYPGKSVCHGGLGWSSIVLLRGHGRVALVDVGAFGVRKTLIKRLADYGLTPKDVTDVLLTHSHYDHSVNWTLFSHARIVIGGDELDWSVNEPWGESPVPELYVRELSTWPTLARVSEGDEVLPGITAYDAPGHTPGHLIFVLRGREHDVVFTGDAAKNRAELVSRDTDMTFDPAVSAASIGRIWDFWTRRPGTVLVPGHDLPMVLDGGVPRFLGEREAAISAWMGDGMDETRLFRLSGT
ncbi:MBL fold metallo-hydrolase [Lutibaculum baratangense]|uniref:Putative metallo-beta-lactamase n=1 Tax=Lutibaculum baratangense AMV1 TaxID=631454 RepID=V4RC36_9HYPH|nr:MBL fold metallo-hydrolase [Lutibaculum baratangense]ESR23731.1 putative metallo-beta-lactamase [Lutibaculum baratangense AMV1]